jgi:uncharacterized membrane protein
MKIRTPAVLSLGAVAAMLAMSTAAYPHLPNAPMAVHWGLDGQPNGYASKQVAVAVIPCLTAALSLFLALLPVVMPSNARLERSASAYTASWIGLLGLMLIVHASIIAKALGAGFDVVRPIAAAVGLLLLVMGNYLGKVRYNYAMGVRTPWTLSNERVWDKTHRITGRWMMAGGIALAVLAALPLVFDDAFLTGALFVCAVGPTALGAVYSFVISRRIERGA